MTKPGEEWRDGSPVPENTTMTMRFSVAPSDKPRWYISDFDGTRWKAREVQKDGGSVEGERRWSMDDIYEEPDNWHQWVCDECAHEHLGFNDLPCASCTVRPSNFEERK